MGDEQAGDVNLVVEPPEQVRSSSRTLESRAPKGSSRSRTFGRGGGRASATPGPLAPRKLSRVTVGIAMKLDQLEQLVDPG